MSNIKRLSVIAVLTVIGVFGIGMMPPHDFSDRTVAQLIKLLGNDDPLVRTDAAIFLGYRYRKPGPVINPPTFKTQHPEFPLPPDVLPALTRCVQADKDSGVRIAAVYALGDLRYQTNTTPALRVGLSDKDESVRLVTCLILVEVSKQYSDPLAEGVLEVLRESLQPEGNVEGTWYAAWVAGQLGKDGEPLIPDLQRTAEHKSEKVRHSVHEALAKIRKETKKAKKSSK